MLQRTVKNVYDKESTPIFTDTYLNIGKLMKSFEKNSFSKYCKIFLLAPLLVIPVFSIAAPLKFDIVLDAPVQQNQVAFVPFAGDSFMSSIILNNLNSTELKVTSSNFPQQPHSSSELSGTLPVWQNMGIPYLVMGNTSSNRGKINTSYEVVEVAPGRVIEGKQTISTDKSEKSLRRAANIVSDKIYKLITGKPGDFSGRIAYVEETGSGKGKISYLKVVDADGKNIDVIAKVEGSIFSPAWSPDGKRIAYSVQRDKSYQVIYVQNISGGAATVVTPYNGANLSPSFSNDGSKIIFSSSFEGNANIYQINSTGGGLEKLVDWPSDETEPSFAPDGRSFVFVSGKINPNRPQIYRYDLISRQISKVSNGGYAAKPSFNNDGSQIGFLSGRSAAIMNSNGAITANLGNTGSDEPVTFSSSGQRIMYASKEGGKGVINIKSLDGSNSSRIVGDGIIRSPVWSPSSD